MIDFLNYSRPSPIREQLARSAALDAEKAAAGIPFASVEQTVVIQCPETGELQAGTIRHTLLANGEALDGEFIPHAV